MIMKNLNLVAKLVVLSLLFIVLFEEVEGQGFRIAQDDECGKIDESSDDIRTTIPWTAAIFGRAGSKAPFQFTVTGTLIGPSTVLTLFGGAFGVPSSGSSKYFIPRADNYIVAVGLLSNNLNEKDMFTQISQVSHILPWKAQNDQKYYNYFIFHLKKPVNLNTPYVRAACVPVFLKHLVTTPHGRQLEVRQGGFGVPARADGTKDLTMVNITLESKEFCDDAFTQNYNGSPEHTFCGTAISKGQTVCVEPGSSAVVPVASNRWFFITLASLIPKSSSKNWCTSKTVYIYGRIIKAIDWFLTNLKCSPEFACSDFTCVPLSKVCDQRTDCPGGEDEDPIYCRAKKPCIFGDKTHECGIYGKCISPLQICDGIIDCEDGSDESRSRNCPPRLSSVTPGRKSSPPSVTALPFPVLSTRKSFPHCALLQISEGVEIDCQLPNGEYVNCTQSGVNTVARLRCKKYYRSTIRSASLTVTCQEDGSWKPSRSFGCEAECGVISNGGLNAYIYGGEDTSQENAFPWHSAIFKLIKNEYQFICGGSLIERTTLITAGHCVSDLTGAAVDKSQFKIVLGSNSSNYDFSKRDRNAQVFSAKDIFIPATYDRRSLQSDIAIIQLDKAAIYGEAVRPVCYLEQGNNNLPEPGTLGKVPGYGFRENQRISEKLIFAEFPVIAPDECKKALGRTPPLSTFCAGYRNGTSVCQGDSGSSMVFPTTVGSITKYFIRGLVSHGEVKQGRKCDPFNYAVFTHVDAFADWILQRLEGI